MPLSDHPPSEKRAPLLAIVMQRRRALNLIWEAVVSSDPILQHPQSGHKFVLRARPTPPAVPLERSDPIHGPTTPQRARSVLFRLPQHPFRKLALRFVTRVEHRQLPGVTADPTLEGQQRCLPTAFDIKTIKRFHAISPCLLDTIASVAPDTDKRPLVCRVPQEMIDLQLLTTSKYNPRMLQRLRHGVCLASFRHLHRQHQRCTDCKKWQHREQHVVENHAKVFVDIADKHRELLPLEPRACLLCLHLKMLDLLASTGHQRV
mmetsp:Transcript_11317/g.40148  ORF Transcript_11317/g.40148 Transcript_11317/m.40148 type:complete len:262 (-) Transcript_11317:830-1615(-)